jgi:hypothetical protein
MTRCPDSYLMITTVDAVADVPFVSVTVADGWYVFVEEYACGNVIVPV